MKYLLQFQQFFGYFIHFEGFFIWTEPVASFYPASFAVRIESLQPSCMSQQLIFSTERYWQVTHIFVITTTSHCRRAHFLRMCKVERLPKWLLLSQPPISVTLEYIDSLIIWRIDEFIFNCDHFLTWCCWVNLWLLIFNTRLR